MRAPATTRRPDSLRQRRKRATRDALIAAAMERFVASGFDATTVEEIARDVGVSRRTFFRYFASKESVFFAAQEDRLGEFERALAVGGPTPAAAVKAACDAALAMAARYEAERDAVRTEQTILLGSASLHGHDAQLDHRWEDALRGTLVRGGLSDRDATVAAGALLGVMRAVLRRWFVSDAARHARDPEQLRHGADALRAVLGFTYCAMFNPLELPATAVPAGFSSHGLPLGVQVVGRRNNDHLTLWVAARIEEALGGWQPAPIRGDR